MAQKLVSTADIARILGYTVAHVRDKVTKRPDFPKPALRLSFRYVRWDECEVLKWRDRVSQAA